MKYLQSPNSTNAYGLYGDEIGPGHLVAIIEFEPSADGDKLIRPIAAAPALLAACEEALGWIDSIYPPDVFTGESGDEGAVEIVRIREQARATVAEARGEAV